MGNRNLHKAKKAKNDEFYTRLEDIENELQHYKDHFQGKVVYCNCDNPSRSQFWHYFLTNFKQLGLKGLMATHYSTSDKIYRYTTHNGEDVCCRELTGNGDFRSPECVETLEEADIVVTNPPFSLFREYIAQLIEYEKKFIIVGNMNAITYKETFSLIKDGKIWLGVGANITMEFALPESYERYNRVDDDGVKYGKVPAISWYTNLEHSKRNEDIILTEKYYD